MLLRKADAAWFLPEYIYALQTLAVDTRHSILWLEHTLFYLRIRSEELHLLLRRTEDRLSLNVILRHEGVHAILIWMLNDVLIIL